MTIQIADSRARKIVPLETRDPGRVAMYTCGPTVYGYIHIGNARTFLWFDQIRRYLTWRGFHVTYVLNYTDVDDKIIERAAVEGISADAVAKKYSRTFEDDMRALGVQPPDVLCLATDHVDDMVKAIQGLIERGAAYEADGNVFFAVERYPRYGSLSGRTLEDMRAGDRVEPHAGKRNPLDFALWKAAKEGEPSWGSPWGPGRPGWHIECSVMSVRYLGMGFDIHGGGADLLFPHHENEVAQAEALADGQRFVRHWLHAGLVQMEAEKMSKSLGNVVTAKDVLERYPGEIVRYWALTGSYRSQVTFSEAALEDARRAYERWSTFLGAARHVLGERFPSAPESRSSFGDGTGFVGRFAAAMDDDFNSPEALAAVHDLVREGNRRLEDAQQGDEQALQDLVDLVRDFLELTAVLGFTFETRAGDAPLVSELVSYLLELRARAREDKDFAQADAIRARLESLGIVVEDTASGARWRIGEGEA